MKKLSDLPNPNTYLPDPMSMPSIRERRKNPTDKAKDWVITADMLVAPIENESESVPKNDSNNSDTKPVIKTEKPKGKGRGRRKLTEPAVRSIRLQADNGVSKDVLAKLHDVSVTCIHNIVKRNTWKHVV